MPLKQFKLVKDRFLWDEFESGLYFDLYPLKRKAGENQDGLDVRITRALVYLKSIQDHGWFKWFPTLLLNEKQIVDLTPKYEAQFSGKTYLLLYKAGADNIDLPKNLFFGEQGGGMICDPTGAKENWKYYTTWNRDELGNRFRRVDKNEVDAYEFSEGGVVVIPPPVIAPPVDSGGVSGGGGISVPLPETITIGDKVYKLTLAEGGKKWVLGE